MNAPGDERLHPFREAVAAPLYRALPAVFVLDRAVLEGQPLLAGTLRGLTCEWADGGPLTGVTPRVARISRRRAREQDAPMPAPRLRERHRGRYRVAVCGGRP
ncbi:hypothetical protein SAMN05216275_12767 [Streptosporangium canum]|uniref:Uncharacterized protein n=1 Tax=Streptosporangium canum TaxID=324952 RepID=A0A1I4A6J9_9ACTN|nr:hypothetical protein [Streptosporangium canum]SFK51737.1 hypothetical protein SAMN05216275_12767 [Streptosporangium canum]